MTEQSKRKQKKANVKKALCERSHRKSADRDALRVLLLADLRHVARGRGAHDALRLGVSCTVESKRGVLLCCLCADRGKRGRRRKGAEVVK
eukprot:3126357-Rhodomonas_salina.1